MVSSLWMLVASSDDHSSVLSCWNIANVLNGDTEMAACCHLPGPVNTGKTHAQSDGVIIALGLGRP